MKNIKIAVSAHEALDMDKVLFIDMRSPAEFEHSTIPGAINLPLFSDEERAEVGIKYKQKGQKPAVLLGLEFFSPKLPIYIKKIHKLRKKNRIIIFCARGGMRSKAICDLCNCTGFHVFQLEGGYKAYRKFINSYLADYSMKKPLYVLDGLTGVGKTRLLNLLPNSLDLEGLASHRSSLLGSIDLKPVSQKMFDSLLFNKLRSLDSAPFITIEGESRKVGFVQMPAILYKEILKGIHIEVTASMKKRVQYLKEDYTHVDPDEIKPRIKLLTKRLSNKDIDELNCKVDKKQYTEVIGILLEKYYDPLYKHTVDKKDYSFDINNDEPKKAAKKVIEFIENSSYEK